MVTNKKSYSVSPAEMEAFRRKKRRANELGIELFILDEDEMDKELQELEYFIIDNYLDMDKDIPDPLKEKYIKLKELSINRVKENKTDEAK